MLRRFGWLAMIVLCLTMGALISPHQVLRADSSAVASEESAAGEKEMARQLKEIRAQLQDLQTLLCSGKVRVVVVINPSEP